MRLVGGTALLVQASLRGARIRALGCAEPIHGVPARRLACGHTVCREQRRQQTPPGTTPGTTLPPKARNVPGSHGQAICASSGRSSNPGATGRCRDQPCGQHAHSVATSLPPSSADGERKVRSFESYGGRSAWWPRSAGHRRRWNVSSRSAFARCDGAPFVCTFRARESFRVGELSSIITDLVRCRAR